MSKVICSNCGAEVILPETSKLVTGMTISKQGCGVHYLPMEKKRMFDVVALYDEVYIGMEDVSITYHEKEKYTDIPFDDVIKIIKEVCEKWENDPTVINEKKNGRGYYPSSHKTAPCRLVIAISGKLKGKYLGAYSRILDLERNDLDILSVNTSDGFDSAADRIRRHFNEKENNMGIIENSINNVTVNNTENKENKSMTDLRATELSNNGINTNKYFSFKLPNGKTITVDEDGNQVTDEIMNKIENDGFIDNKTLYRRWVMAQFFRMYNFGLNEACKHFTQEYMWKMLAEEVKTLAKLEKKDSEYFAERSQFFTKKVVSRICYDYIDALRINIDRLPSKNCNLSDNKGNNTVVPYKRIWGENIFVAQIEKKIFRKYSYIATKVRNSKNYTELSKALNEFIKEVHYLPSSTPNVISPTWLDAYKGAGAYYTLQNMVLYHHCKLLKYEDWSSLRDREYLTGNDAYKFMQSRLGEYDNYQWVGMFKRCVEDNNFSFGSKPYYFYK